MMTELLIPADLRTLTAVRAEHEQRLLAMPNVVGVALGHKHTRGKDTGTACVTVLVDMKLDPELLRRDEFIPAARPNRRTSWPARPAPGRSCWACPPPAPPMWWCR